MKVGFIDRSGANSIWSVLHPVADGLISEGHDVFFIKIDDGKQRETLKAPKGVKIKIIKIPSSNNFIAFCAQQLILLLCLRREISSGGYDILHGNFIYPSWAARVISSIYKIPYVNTRHETRTSMSKTWRLIDKLTLNKVDAHVFISKVVADSFLKHNLQIDTSKTYTITNGIDISLLKNINFNEKNLSTDIVVLCAGRFVDLKNQISLINSWPLVIEKLPSAQLHLSGEGPEEVYLKNRCLELGIDNTVRFLGWLSKNESLEKIHSSTVVVVPSLDEGFGLVVAEAMILKTPIVCSDISIFKEVAADTALFFPPTDEYSLAKSIIKAVEDTEYTKNRVKRASKRASDLFNQDYMVASYIELYKRILVNKDDVQ